MKHFWVDHPGRVLACAGLLLLASMVLGYAPFASAVDRLVELRETDQVRISQEPARATTNGGPGYDLSWWTVDGGGTTSAGANGYTLGGTAGQPDAAVWSGGAYTLSGGFWGGALVEYHVYLPLVLRSS